MRFHDDSAAGLSF